MKHYECAYKCNFLLKRNSWFTDNVKWQQLVDKCPSPSWKIIIEQHRHDYLENNSPDQLIGYMRELMNESLRQLKYSRDYIQFKEEKSTTIIEILKLIYDEIN